MKTSPEQTHFKTMRLTTIRNIPKRTIFVGGGLRLLQIVSELDTKRCTNKDVEPSRGMDHCGIPRWLEMETKYFLQGCGNLSLVDAFIISVSLFGTINL